MQAVKDSGCRRQRSRSGAHEWSESTNVWMHRTETHPRKKITKKVEKLLKNLLTNEKRCDIIRRSLCEGNNFQRAQESHEKVFEKLFKTS